MFDINKCATAVAAAMVSTIRTGDDANRFASRAAAEGKSSISDLIAADAVKQALAIRAEIESHAGNAATAVKVSPPDTQRIAPPVSAATVTVLGDGAAVPTAEAPALDDFADPKKIFASGATELAAVHGGGVSSAGDQDSPLPPATSATVPDATTSTSSITETATSVVVDSAGLPWDGRIHASSKQFLVKTGEWKLKRGVAPELVDQVNSELRQAMAAGNATAPASGVSSAPAEDMGGKTVTAEGVFSAGNASANGTAQSSPNPAPGAPAGENAAFGASEGNASATAGGAASGVSASNNAPHSIKTFADLMRGITSNKIDPAYVGEVVKQFGIPSTPVLATRPDLIPQVAAALGI